MNLLEYEAKQLLKESSVPVPFSTVIRHSKAPAFTTPIVLKSQVPTGGRGKLGGIVVAKTSSEISNAIEELFKRPIKDFLPKTLLAEEYLTIKNEFYLSLLIDRKTASIQLIAHPNGGVEVEENNPEDFLKITLQKESIKNTGEQLAELYDTPDQSFALQDIVESLHDCFIKNDATLIEINPLIITAEGKIFAGDCKMTLDDAAAFRHPEWSFDQQNTAANFVTLNQEGNIATIANGAGLAMATVDAVANYDMQPANFLDIGGGANAESVVRAFKNILEYPNVKAIVINIFAGITRCDEVAKAIIQAKEAFSALPPLCIRLSGTNFKEASDLLMKNSIPLLPTLESCLEQAKEYTR